MLIYLFSKLIRRIQLKLLKDILDNEYFGGISYILKIIFIFKLRLERSDSAVKITPTFS